LKHETEWREGRHAAVYTFRNGRTIEMRIFDNTRQALEWAGVTASFHFTFIIQVIATAIMSATNPIMETVVPAKGEAGNSRVISRMI
jgi:hypothetical protein